MSLIGKTISWIVKIVLGWAGQMSLSVCLDPSLKTFVRILWNGGTSSITRNTMSEKM